MLRLGIIGCVILGLADGCASFPSHSIVSLPDIEGRQVDPFRNHHHMVAVFFFVRNDCPISNRYAPEMERLYSAYHPRGIDFWLVYPDADISPQDIKAHLEEYHLSLPALRDPEHLLVKKAGVKVTPEAAVFVGTDQEIYRGRIDDRYVDLGKERPSATEHDLEDAIRSVLAGHPARKITRAVGCYIPE